MPKYHDLAEEYSADIEKIKSLCAKANDLRNRADQIDPIVHPEPDWEAIGEQERLYEQYEKTYYQMSVLADRLNQDIEAAYSAVPFAHIRKAGIDGFYRESGLQRP